MQKTAVPTLQLERVEIEAWSDLYEAAGTLKENPCGIGLHREVKGENECVASVVPGADVLALNRIVGWGRGEFSTDESLRSLVDIYRKAGTPRIFLQLHTERSDSRATESLGGTGFTFYNNWVKLYRKAEPLQGIKSDLEVAEIGPERAEEFGQIVTACFDWDFRLKPWIGSVAGRRGWHLYLALDRDRPVATAGFYHSGEYAWVDMAATLPEARGRGAQALLMQRRIEDAIKLGCKHLVVETAQDRPDHSAPSYRNMIRFGFEVAYVRPNYLYKF